MLGRTRVKIRGLKGARAVAFGRTLILESIRDGPVLILMVLTSGVALIPTPHKAVKL